MASAKKPINSIAESTTIQLGNMAILRLRWRGFALCEPEASAIVVLAALIDAANVGYWLRPSQTDR
jgi:hypothetical protein